MLWRPSYHLAFDLSLNRNAIALSAWSFTANVFAGRMKYAFSTRLFVSSFVQYNAAADQLVTNLRLNFIHAPLSHLFIAYVERRSTAGAGVFDRAVTVKITRLLSF